MTDKTIGLGVSGKKVNDDGKKESDQYLHMMLFNAQIAVNARGREKQQVLNERQRELERAET